MVENYHRLATPTIVIGKRIFVGFRENRAEIEKMLSLHSQQGE